MKKIVAIVLIFLISTLTLVGCVSPKDNYNPPPEPNNPIYIASVFEIDGEYTTFVHLHIPDSNATTKVKIPKVFVYTEDLLHYEEVESLNSHTVIGNDDVGIYLSTREIFAKNPDNPQIDNLITLTNRAWQINGINDLQIRVTKGDYES